MMRLDNVIRIGALILSLSPACAGAMDLAVTRTDDPPPNGCQPGDCSLREAVILANGLAGPDRIVLAAGLYQLTITGAAANDPTIGDLDIDDDVEIAGAGAASTMIVAGNMNRLFSASTHRLTMRNLTLEGGRADTGGAILTDGPLTIEDAMFSNNQATGSGGAINAGAAEIVLRRAHFSNNTAGSVGGAVHAGAGGVLVVDSTLSANTSSSSDGGGIYSDGPTRIYRSLIENNHAVAGGGISEFSGSLEVRESTIAGNVASDSGGGIYAGYPVLVDRSTLSGNSATFNGGALAVSDGLSVSGDAIVTSSTLYLNTAASGSAEYFYDFAVLPAPILTNTVISGTCASNGSRSFNVPIGNVESPGNTCNLGGSQPHDVADLKLGALADNGGPTPTHLPLAGSVVIGAGQNCQSYDQRGFGLISTVVCDSGALSTSAVDDAIFRDDFDF